jgi:hypothetical protein
MGQPDDIAALENQFAASEKDAQALLAGLDEQLGSWRESPGSWSVAECLDHLATTNRVYLQPMREAAERARAEGRMQTFRLDRLPYT